MEGTLLYVKRIRQEGTGGRGELLCNLCVNLLRLIWINENLKRIGKVNDFAVKPQNVAI